MNKRTLILCVILTVLSFVTIARFERAQAACDYAATCDASGTTCNGGYPCYIGNTICEGNNTTYSGPYCAGNRDNDGFCHCGGYDPGNIGTPCGTAYDPGVCSCTVTNEGCTVECTDTYWPTCGGGGTCGWGAWSECSATCGGGVQSRYNSCNGTTQTQACNTQACPLPTPLPTPGAPTPQPSPCVFGGWSTCSASCGGGTQTRTDNCGNTQTQSCNTQECPCSVGAWSACSATCGAGTQTRTNSCVSGGVETQTCNTCSLGCACSMSCGQSTDCGTCSASGLGTAGVTTLNPSSGTINVPSNRQVTVSWSAVTGAESYDVQIYPTGTTTGQECTAANTFCVSGTTSTNYTFTAPTGVANYSWRVRTINTTCDAIDYMTATASDEYLTSEGASYNMTADKAVDGSDATGWNAGGFPTQWIELDLKGTRTISGMRMATNHYPDGAATIQIYAGASPNPTTLVTTINPTITAGDILNVTFSSAVPNVRYIRVVTTADVSWVGWAELTPYFSDGTGIWVNGTFTLVGTITGNFYLDQTSNAALNLATGLCELSGSPAGQDPGVGSSIGATWQGGGSATGSITGSTYTINGVHNYNNIGVALTPDAAWKCSCPFGCTYSGRTIPESGVNFYISSVANPWWQSWNGLIYAGTTSGNAVVSQIPESCTGAGCLGYLSLRNATDASSSSGFVITGGGDIDSDPDNVLRYTKLREEAEQGHVVGSVYSGPRENYQYFYNLYSMGSSPTTDFDGSEPTLAPSNGRAYYAAGNVTISTPWDVEAGQNMVIFVNGNLDISNTIHVAEGGFLSFIVNGNVTVANTVGNSTFSDNTPNVEGVYIADRIIIQGGASGGDLKFVGAGTFVGWTSVTLGRTYDDPFTNDTYPSEVFIFRPDFVQNVPARMTRPIYSWQETN